jgi:hypothetical protein
MSNLLLHTAAVVHEDGVIVLKGIPVHKGQRIEVAVYAVENLDQEMPDPMVLRQEPFHDADPFEPVAGNEWEALQ